MNTSPSRFFSLCLAVFFATISSSASTPAQLASYTEPYTELLSNQAQVWACRYGDLAFARLIVNADVPVTHTEFALPPRTLRLAVSPDGVFYAVATGTESGTNPSVHLWEKTSSGSWTHAGQIQATDLSAKVSAAEIVFVNRTVIVNLTLQSSFYMGGIVRSGGPADPALVHFNRDTRSFSLGPTEFNTILGSVPLYTLKNRPSVFSSDTLLRSEDGVIWTEVTVPAQPLNNLDLLVGLGTAFPRQASAQFLFFWDTLTSSVSVMHESGERVRYNIPFEANGYGAANANTPVGSRYNAARLDGMIVSRGGESFIGFFQQMSAEGGASRSFIVCSDDYLQTFNFYTYLDEGYISNAPTSNACYFLRRTPAGTALHRVVFPPTRITTGSRPKLTPSAHLSTFFNGSLGRDPVSGQMVPVSVDRNVIDMLIEAADGSFHQIETSTDLEHWTPVGLPLPAGKTASFIINPEESRRFYR